MSAIFSSALVGWLLLRGIAPAVLALLMESGAGGMLYLTVAKLLPEAEERQYQQSGRSTGPLPWSRCATAPRRITADIVGGSRCRLAR